MTGQFDNVTLPPNGGAIEVRGPFKVDNDPQIDGDIESAEIHFVIVQGKGNDTVTAVGKGTWARGDSEWIGQLDANKGKHPDGTDGTFSTDVDEGRARGIGLAIAIKAEAGEMSGEKFIPPAFQTLTWCADFKFVPEGTT